MFNFKKVKDVQDSLIGISLSSSGFRMVECCESKGNISAFTLAGADFAGKFDKNDFEIVGKELKKYLSELDFNGRNVNVVLRDPDIKLKFKRIPYVDNKELEKIMEIEKEKENFDTENEITDYAVLGEIKEEESKRLLVIIVTEPKKTVNRLVELIRDVSLEPYYIEVTPLALARLLLFNKELKPDSNYVIIDDGNEGVFVYMFRGNLFCLNRQLYSVGGNVIVNAIAEKLGVDFNQAYKIKKELNLDKAGQKQQKKEIFDAIDEVLERKVIEIERSVRYFTNEYPIPDIEKVFLTGDNLIYGIDNYISKKIKIPVEIINPFKKIKLSNSNVAEGTSDYSYAAATGLALKKFVK